MTTTLRKPDVSWLAILAIAIVMFAVGNNIKPWKSQKVIQHDVNSYYAYLPAFFIYGDLSFEFTRNLPAGFNGNIWVHRSEQGGLVSKMPIGCAIMYTPFFLLGHGVASVTIESPTGYDPVYHFFIWLGAFVYALLAAIILRKILLRFVSKSVAALALLAVYLATNLFYYVVIEAGMSHVYSLFLFAAFIELSIRWIERSSAKHLILLGVTCGLIVLVRPTNGILALFPLLYSINKRSSFGDWVIWIKRQALPLTAAVVLGLLLVSLQLAYWKFATDQWVYTYSYGEEGFFFSSPQILKGLFGFRKGFFVYTPLMIFAIWGMVLLFRNNRGLFWPILIILGIHIYIVFSWWCWWYGGGFGSRPMIETYSLLVIPLAIVIEKIFSSTTTFKKLVMIALFGFFALNMLQTYQYRKAMLHWDGMTARSYFGIFGRISYPKDYEKLIERPDYEKALKGEAEN